MDGEKEEIEENLVMLRRLVLDKLRALRKEELGQEKIDELGLVFKVFTLKFLKIEYEFTNEELSLELDKKILSPSLKNKIANLSSYLDEIKYHEKSIDRRQYLKLIDEITELVTSAVEEAEVQITESKVEAGQSKITSSLAKNIKNFL